MLSHFRCFLSVAIVDTAVNCVWADYYDKKEVVASTSSQTSTSPTAFKENETFSWNYFGLYDFIWPLIIIMLLFAIVFFYWMTRLVMLCYQRFQVFRYL